MFHFYHNYLLTGSGKVVMASSDALESYSRIMEMVKEVHVLQQKATICQPPPPSGREPIVLMDMAFLE